MRMVKLSFNKDVLLHQGWRSREVKRKGICEASFRKIKSPTKSSAGVLSWEVEKWKASQNDSVELLIFPSPLFWMERMKASISAYSWNSLVPRFLFSLYRKEDHNALLYTDSTMEPAKSVVLWAGMPSAKPHPAPDQGHGRTQKSLDYTTNEVTVLHFMDWSWQPRPFIFSVYLVLSDYKFFREVAFTFYVFPQPGTKQTLTQTVRSTGTAQLFPLEV